MALMMGAVYDALKEAGASDDKARKAAEEMTVNNDAIAALKGKVDVLTWMAGFNLALTVAILFVLSRLIPHA